MELSPLTLLTPLTSFTCLHHPSSVLLGQGTPGWVCAAKREVGFCICSSLQAYGLLWFSLDADPRDDESGSPTALLSASFEGRLGWKGCWATSSDRHLSPGLVQVGRMGSHSWTSSTSCVLWDGTWGPPLAQLVFKTPNLPPSLDDPCSSQLHSVLSWGSISTAGCWVLLPHKWLSLCYGHQQAAFLPSHCPTFVFAHLYHPWQWIFTNCQSLLTPVYHLRQACSCSGTLGH